jgi:hypothetical protein
MKHTRHEVERRLNQLEGAFGNEVPCKCGLPLEVAAKPWSVAIVSAWPGNPQDVTCPDCGRARYVLRWAFPLTVSDRR